MVQQRRPERSRGNRRPEHSVYGRHDRERSRSPRRDTGNGRERQRSRSPTGPTSRADDWRVENRDHIGSDTTETTWGGHDNNSGCEHQSPRQQDYRSHNQRADNRPSIRGNANYTPLGNHHHNSPGRGTQTPSRRDNRPSSSGNTSWSDNSRAENQGWIGSDVTSSPSSRVEDQRSIGANVSYQPRQLRSIHAPEDRPKIEDEWKGAPAFKPKPKPIEDQSQFQWLIRDDTEDPSRAVGPWNDWGRTTDAPRTDVNMAMENPDIEASENVRSMFVKPEHIMRNPDFKNAKVNRGKITIRNHIGDTVLETHIPVDDRHEKLNREGTAYVDSINRGQPKKRILVERKRRFEVRDDEIQAVSRIQQTWDRLPQEEKDAILAYHHRTSLALDKLVRCEVSYGLPEVYEQLSRPTTSRRIRSRFSEVESSGGASSTPAPPVIERQSSTESEVLFVEDAEPITRPDARPSRPATPEPATPEETVPEPDKGIIYSIDEWPDLPPIKDASNRSGGYGVSDDEMDEKMGRYYKAKDTSEVNGRVVGVKLSSELIDFTRQAITDRVFGGNIQQAFFFPEDRKAIVVFLHPWEAKAFVQHVHNARNFSNHEYRRLQIAVDWYKGDEKECVYPYQPRLMFCHIVEGVTRVLKLTGIHKKIKQQDLLADLMAKFGGKGLVKLVLVTPKKRYEQDKSDYSNEALLEFSSLLQASEAKAIFDRGNLPDFSCSTASYMPDPSARKPTTFDWCSCAPCAANHSEEILSLRHGELMSVEKRVSKDVRPVFGALRPSDWENRATEGMHGIPQPESE